MENFDLEQNVEINEIPIDDFIIEEGFAIAEEEQSLPEKKKIKVNWQVLKPIIWIAVIFAISISLTAFILSVGSDYLGIGPGKNGTEYAVEIPENSDLDKIADILHEKGLVKHKLIFKMYSKLKHYDEKYKIPEKTVYVFCDDDGYSGIANKLVEAGNPAQTVRVTIPERFSVEEIVALLVEKGVGTKEELIKAINETAYQYKFLEDIPADEVYYRLEGYLYPDTYEFYCHGDKEECARLAIEKMLSTMDKRFEQKMRDEAESRGYTMHEILTVASMIELEASKATFEERQKIASVFYNRISSPETNYKLQSDPTVFYPNEKNALEAYNTYEIKGLPPGPLCSPSLSSIKAAIAPLDTDYLYFVNDKDGKFYFNKTYKAHQNEINRLKKEDKYPEK